MMLQGYRKLIAFALCLLVIVGMAALGVAAETPYYAVSALLAAFTAGNWAEHRRGKVEMASQTQPPEYVSVPSSQAYPYPPPPRVPPATCTGCTTAETVTLIDGDLTPVEPPHTPHTPRRKRK